MFFLFEIHRVSETHPRYSQGTDLFEMSFQIGKLNYGIDQSSLLFLPMETMKIGNGGTETRCELLQEKADEKFQNDRRTLAVKENWHSSWVRDRPALAGKIVYHLALAIGCRT
ncbi:hypothetical protein C5167_044257 [Papaver somniferum]|uniref:Uncharacterized protein n=1 Tax=Papaver somniferum TaxID=3469 RepID=A0A4Y7LBL5_PAPSO|nr:hypothetical protein C5167_044257 [Papaver somniferum]